MRLDVVELEERALGTAAVRANEGATTLVATPHGAAHGGGNVSRSGRAWPSCAGMLDGGGLGAFEIADEQRERTVDNRRQVAAWDRVTQQILGAAQLVVGQARDGQLNPVAFGRERREDCRARRGAGDRWHCHGVISGRSHWPAHRSGHECPSQSGRSRRHRHLANYRRHVGLWPQSSDERFDRALAQVSRLRQHCAMIRVREVRRKERDRRQRQRPVSQSLKEHRKSPRRARRLDPSIGGVLRQVQHVCAVREQRRAPGLEVESSRVELGQQRDELRGGMPLTGDSGRDLGCQRFIGQMLRCVDRCHSPL